MVEERADRALTDQRSTGPPKVPMGSTVGLVDPPVRRDMDKADAGLLGQPLQPLARQRLGRCPAAASRGAQRALLEPLQPSPTANRDRHCRDGGTARREGEDQRQFGAEHGPSLGGPEQAASAGRSRAVRKLLLLVVPLLLAACSSAPPATPSPLPAASPTAAFDSEWRVLGTELSLSGTPFAVRVALGPTAFEMLWSELGGAQPRPPVDFASEVVIYLGMSGSSSCPEILDGIVVDEQSGRVFGRWHPQQGRACTDDLGPQGMLLAVPRDLLPSETFLLSLRETPICADCPTQPDQLMVDPAASNSR